ncbi:dihydrofolate reductase [Streptomyces phyllanthi]|uniref:dihydrofolate reductase n=1 Tax=Streptomyces phyllanthi TaxID=1803180 RepID=UPI00128E2015|nr:dihydrofolate reductase [Streptomyces phyllanthi]
MIVAASENDVIGREGDLPWHIPGDLRHFKRLTQGHVVVLGRLTHESIVARLGGPLPGRTSVVVSRSTPSASSDVHWRPSVPSALSLAVELEESAGKSEVFVIGGASIYTQALPTIDRIYLTRVHAHVEGDSRMPPEWLKGFALTSELDGPAGHSAFAHSFLQFEREKA